MTVYTVPTIGDNQSFSIDIAGNTYRMLIMWSDADGGGYVMDISDDQGNPLVCGILLSPNSDLLQQYAYLNFGFQMYVDTPGYTGQPPTRSNFGTESFLYVSY